MLRQHSREYAEIMNKVHDPVAGDEIDTVANCLVMDTATEGLWFWVWLQIAISPRKAAEER